MTVETSELDLSTLVFEGDRTHPRLIVRRAGNVEHVHLQARWTLRRMAAMSRAENDKEGARKVDECRVDLMEAERHRKLSAIGREDREQARCLLRARRAEAA